MSRPSFPFYPDDWMNDLGLRGCSPATRGIWADMLCLMHQGEPYGHLAGKAGPLSVAFVAARCGVTTRQLTQAIAELESHGVFSREGETIYSRRMVRDERVRNLRANGGSQSLRHPNVPRRKDSLKDTHEGYPLIPPHRQGVDSVDDDVKASSSEKEKLPFSPGELHETYAAVALVDPSADMPFVLRLYQAVAQCALSNDIAPDLITDHAVANAVREVASRKRIKSAGLLLSTVPNVIVNWSRQ